MDAVDVAIVLAIDVSASVDFDEFTLMVGGLSNALRDPDLESAILEGPRQAIALAALFWSEDQAVAATWMRVDGRGPAEAFAAQLDMAPRQPLAGATALGEGLAAALRLLAACPADSRRQVIDVSGDGRSNRGRPPALLRDLAVSAGVSINGLAVLNEEPDLLDYYTSDVAGGPGAFVIPANDYAAFGEAMRRKLLRELRGPGPLIT
ncbi:MAG: DUF1194 domain-containing protein [Rubritepida sp.]|nr:DUF1194 domain-containing protein [Rubritepida sp.]